MIAKESLELRYDYNQKINNESNFGIQQPVGSWCAFKQVNQIKSVILRRRVFQLVKKVSNGRLRRL